jgi:L-threonylcarbamoyladenylate synthase
VIHPFLKNFRQGHVCLHPTDSLPGLTFDPFNPAAFDALTAVKGERLGKGFIGLVDSMDTALRFWEPLPGDWEQRLRKLWPAPLSVIWTPSRRAPRCMLAPEGTLALRVPLLDPALDWFSECLLALGHPIPTTSVNRVGEPAATTWDAAREAVRSSPNVFFPVDPVPPLTGQPSTLIRLLPDGQYEILRQGAFPCENLP